LADESAARRYAELAGPAIEHFGGRFIVSNTEPVVAEGESPSNHLSMVEFPSMEGAKAWYNSPEYAEARDLTPAAFRGRLLIFAEGVKTKTALRGSLTATTVPLSLKGRRGQLAELYRAAPPPSRPERP
jgi:uncharacterized protein (DUF1330 family)